MGELLTTIAIGLFYAGSFLATCVLFELFGVIQERWQRRRSQNRERVNRK